MAKLFGLTLDDLDNTDINFEVSKKLTKEEKEDIDSFITGDYTDRKMVSFIVDQYYQSQAFRIVAQNQARSLQQGFDESADYHHPDYILRTLKNAMAQEKYNQAVMEYVSKKVPFCQWLSSFKGIGWTMAAYYYQAFDITRVHYPTEFISYAGLNDNNNPWLGKEGAAKLTKEALDFRDKLYAPHNELFRKYIIEELGQEYNEEKIKKFLKSVVKYATDKEHLILREDIMVIFSYNFDKVFNRKKDSLDLIEYFEENGYTRDSIYKFLIYKAQPNRVDDLLYAYCAKITTRKVVNIKNGTINAWQSKKEKTDYPTVGDLQSYLAKPPYNRELKKRLYVTANLSFVMNKNRGSLYGRILDQRLAEEKVKNEMLEYKDQAEEWLEKKKYKPTSQAYKLMKQGKLCDGHLVLRAYRYAEKLFVSHIFEAMWWNYYHEPAPSHYILSIGGHHDYIAPEVDYREFF